jgi:hypothetical protein
LINDNLKIFIDKKEDYNSNELLKLNNSQIIVDEYYKSNGLQNGLICNATGTGKTNCIYLTIKYSNITKNEY